LPLSNLLHKRFEPPTANTMDHSSNTSPRTTPQSPAPLALSEYMAQATPCSDTTHPSEKPPLSTDVKEPEAVEEPKPAPVLDAPQLDTPQTTTRQQQPEEKQPQPPHQEGDTPDDWLATRQQLLPRRTQGKRADWIRGWSQAVSSHGDEAYCACSETIESIHGRGRKSKSMDLAGNVRAILHRTSSPSSPTKSPATDSADPEVCRNCNRPTYPPPNTAAETASTLSEKSHSHRTRNLGKRLSNLFTRVRPSRSKSTTRKREQAIRNMTWNEEYQPQWATTGQGEKRLLVRPPSQPVSAPVGGTMPKSREGRDFFGGIRNSHSRGRIPTNAAADAGPSSSGLEGITDSDAPRGGMSRSLSRLQRAAALLQRATGRPKD
jgi:hypothetical protein